MTIARRDAFTDDDMGKLNNMIHYAENEIIYQKLFSDRNYRKEEVLNRSVVSSVDLSTTQFPYTLYTTQKSQSET
jgi:hypothetical protein